MPDDADFYRWQVATLTGRLRCVEGERDAAVRDRDRSLELVRRLRRSRSYRIGRLLTDLARDPFRAVGSRLGPRIRRRFLTPRRVRRVERPRSASAPAARRPLPGRVYVAIGLSRPAAHALVRALRQRIVVNGDHLPVVITDQPALRGLQVPGVVLEYLPDPQTWARHDPGEDWESLLAGRVAQLCRDHRATGAVVVDPRDPPTLARLLEPVTAG